MSAQLAARQLIRPVCEKAALLALAAKANLLSAPGKIGPTAII